MILEGFTAIKEMPDTIKSIWAAGQPVISATHKFILGLLWNVEYEGMLKSKEIEIKLSDLISKFGNIRNQNDYDFTSVQELLLKRIDNRSITKILDFNCLAAGYKLTTKIYSDYFNFCKAKIEIEKAIINIIALYKEHRGLVRSDLSEVAKLFKNLRFIASFKYRATFTDLSGFQFLSCEYLEILAKLGKFGNQSESKAVTHIRHFIRTFQSLFQTEKYVDVFLNSKYSRDVFEAVVYFIILHFSESSHTKNSTASINFSRDFISSMISHYLIHELIPNYDLIEFSDKLKFFTEMNLYTPQNFKTRFEATKYQTVSILMHFISNYVQVVDPVSLDEYDNLLIKAEADILAIINSSDSSLMRSLSSSVLKLIKKYVLIILRL